MFNTWLFLTCTVVLNARDFYLLVSLQWGRLYLPVYVLLVGYVLAFTMGLFTFWLFLYHCWLVLNDTTTLQSSKRSFPSFLSSLLDSQKRREMTRQFQTNWEKKVGGGVTACIWPDC